MSHQRSKAKAFDESVLHPGVRSQEGFLLEWESLREVMTRDEAALKELGITHKQVADRLRYVMGRASHLCWEIQDDVDDIWKRIDRGFTVGGVKVTWRSWCGYQNCPFGCADDMECAYGIQFPKERHREALSDTDYTMSNAQGSLFVSELLPHLIEHHHFFEGGTKYRVDPAICVKVLDIKPGIDYTPRHAKQAIWSCSHAASGPNMNLEKEFVGYLEEKDTYENGTIIDLGRKGVTARQKGDNLLIVADGPIDGKFVIDGLPVNDFHSGFAFYTKTEFDYVVKAEGEKEIGGP